MSEKFCPNCNFKNDEDSEFCIECGSPLDIEKYIESKKLDKNFKDKVKSIFGNKRIDEINEEIEDFIKFSQNFNDYYNDLSDLTIFILDKDDFKDKYSKISKLDDYKYLDEINEDEDLNKKVLFLKSIKTFINNFDKEIEKLNKLLEDIEQKMPDIDAFNKELSDLLNSDNTLSLYDKHKLIQAHKFTFDFFDRDKITQLNIDSKDKIRDFLNDYQNINEKFEKHNEELEIKKRAELLSKNLDNAEKFIKKLNDLKQTDDFIPSNTSNEIKSKFEESYEFFKEEDISDLDVSDEDKSHISEFLNDFKDLNKIIKKINEDITIQRLQEKVNSKIDELNQFNSDLNNLLKSNFYITYKQKDDLIYLYNNLFDLIFDANKKIQLSKEFSEFLEVYPNLDYIIKSRNEEYVENELKEHEDFFDNIDGKTLDKNQRLAVVKNELNSQIIAGAGCGKTLTVNAKVRYLIEKKGVNPNEILCLSFSNASVSDLKEKLPEDVEISTFHKLGGSILNANDKPSRPDNDAIDNFIKEYFKNHVINNEKLCEDIFEFYSYYLYSSINEDQATSLGEVYDIEEAKDFRTLRELYGGDNDKITYDNKRVKSLEELIIANYLFAHQIDYDYEKIFECDNKYYLTQKEFVFNLVFSEFDEIMNYPILFDELIGNIYDLCEIKDHIVLKNHIPDFYIKENKIYLEHFGVNRNCEALWLDEENSDKYRQGIIWKRQLHKNYGSKLLETYSYYMSEGRLLTKLEEKLKKAGVEIKEIDFQYMLSKIVERDKVNRYQNFMNLITTFIQLFKGNDFTIDKFDEFKKENESNEDEFDKKRTNLFLNIVEDVYIAYENHLKEISKIDFNDMINNATHEVEKGNLHKNYRYILVDEYQDTSYTRYNLVKAIQNKTGAKVCVVGDDWQSIYRFTGCDVALFSKFEDYFENPEKLKIETTYRNSQELIDISGRFIKKNPNQINKSLHSNKYSSTKPVKIIYYNNSSKQDKVNKLEFLIDRISKESNDIMILGRNNFDIDVFIEEGLFKRKNKDDSKLEYHKNPDLDINFISVHKSKGLEEDNVILINLENKITGFPNQMIDDPLMNFVINDSDQYPHGEERRLFYVALTRTKNNVYLLAPETDKSEFVLELEENIDDLDVISQSDNEEVYDDIEEFMENKNVYSIKTKLKCPVCKTGDIILKIIKKKDGTNIFKFFECSHKRCEWDGGFYHSDLDLMDEIEFCPECGGIMQVKNGRYGPFFSCSNRCKTPKIKGERLKRINDIIGYEDESIKFETVSSKLTCPKCGEGNVILKIHPVNKRKNFACSNDDCDWDGGSFNQPLERLDSIDYCEVPDCDGITYMRSGQFGDFRTCSNYFKTGCKGKAKKVSKTKKRPKKSNTVKQVKTKLKCPSCKLGDVVLINKKFVCSKEDCDWDGGSFNQPLERLDSIDYCEVPDCDGITYMRSGQFGDFRTCSNYFKTGCKGKAKKVSKTKKRPKKDNNIKKIKTNLKCPECNSGDVILNKNTKTGRGYFKCSSCNWDGGPFNQSEEVLNTLDYCPVDGCKGLTFMQKGKYGPFKACTYYVKTKCNGGRK